MARVPAARMTDLTVFTWNCCSVLLDSVGEKRTPFAFRPWPKLILSTVWFARIIREDRCWLGAHRRASAADDRFIKPVAASYHMVQDVEAETTELLFDRSLLMLRPGKACGKASLYNLTALGILIGVYMSLSFPRAS